MKVDLTRIGLESSESSKNVARAGQTTTAGADSTATQGSAAGADQASLSFDQARVQSLQAQVLTQAEIRQARVQAVQQAVGSGRYSVSAGQIADALLRDVNAV